MTSSTLEPENNSETQLRPQNSGNGRGRKSTPKSSSAKAKAQAMFFISCILVVLILIPFTTETYKLVQDYLKDKPNGYRNFFLNRLLYKSYEWPSIGDFWITLAATPFFLMLENAFQYFLYPWYYQHCKEKVDLEARDQRTRKAVTNIYKCIYYTAATIVGWYTLKDSYILPPALGGKGSLDNLFTDFPYITPPPLYRFYFTGTMGYHIGSLLHHTFAHKKANDNLNLFLTFQQDYLEMMFHHLVTFYLYAFSYMTNTLIGAVIAYIHDIADVGVTWTRAWSESNHKKFTAYSFLLTLVFWFYTTKFNYIDFNYFK